MRSSAVFNIHTVVFARTCAHVHDGVREVFTADRCADGMRTKIVFYFDAIQTVNYEVLLSRSVYLITKT